MTAAAVPATRRPHTPAPPGRARLVRGLTWIACLAVLLVLSIPIAVGLGPVRIAPGVVADILVHHLFGAGQADWAVSDDNIVWKLRAPRVLLGACVGAALAVAGIAVQALVRNPLADPYLLGVSSGASAGAAATILFGLGVGTIGLTGSAFAGALLAIALVFAVARTGGTLIGARLVFAGISVAFALTAVTNFLIFASDSRDGARAVLFWTLGSLAQAHWGSLPIAAAAAIGITAAMAWQARRLDALAIGDEAAHSLGADPTRFRALAALLVAFAVAAAVAVAGAIGFVGLVVPHLVRLLVGASHRLAVPAAALGGALLLVWADALARTMLAPGEIPLGILTSLVGTPLLIVLVRRLDSR
ncbi:FecCD family ABC transporter permease [Glycomyces buryatensis]|uniref:Iron ABC transporter permease n=1 Tax=Glycomyces buryatensis TaxID=2570927 RepID=A0A4S8PV58_9ACTN|nr:iron ABC transporter permease [Glycomyces buryatensis]THV33652.1 iron ABC transporter permease [Glycomyces buryatensis]